MLFFNYTLHITKMQLTVYLQSCKNYVFSYTTKWPPCFNVNYNYTYILAHNYNMVIYGSNMEPITHSYSHIFKGYYDTMH